MSKFWSKERERERERERENTNSMSMLIFVKPFTTQSQLLTTLKKNPFENIVGKGENAGNQHFLLFPQCLLPIPRRISDFNLHSFCRL